MDPSTYDYLKPSEDKTAQMQVIRNAARVLGEILERNLPDGPDKTHTLRTFRTAMMWANVSITRHPDGTPRAG